MEWNNKKDLRLEILKRDNYKCRYCGMEVIPFNAFKTILTRNPKNLATIDHIKPKSKGGELTLENSVTCCYRCNNILANKFETFEEKKKYIETLFKIKNNILSKQELIRWEREQRKKEKLRFRKFHR